MSDDKLYKDGDIVWVKLGNSWWPGEVTGVPRQPEGLLRHLKRKPYCVVKFFQEDAYEYVKSAKQIYPFQSNIKAEFIQKGLALYNAKKKFMEKFPADVEVAERLTRKTQADADTLIINNRPDSIVKAILGQSLTRRSNDYYENDYAIGDVVGGANKHNSNTRRSGDSVTKILNITPQRTNATSGYLSAAFAGSAQSSTAARKSLTESATSGSVTSAASSGSAHNATTDLYRCNLCDFTSLRQNVIIFHRKSHSNNNCSAATTTTKTATATIRTAAALEKTPNNVGVKTATSATKSSSSAVSTPAAAKLSLVASMPSSALRSSQQDTVTPTTSQPHRKIRRNDDGTNASASLVGSATVATYAEGVVASHSDGTALFNHQQQVQQQQPNTDNTITTAVARLPKKKELASLAMCSATSRRVLRSSPQMAADMAGITLPPTVAAARIKHTATPVAMPNVAPAINTSTPTSASTSTRNSEEIRLRLLADWSDEELGDEEAEQQQQLEATKAAAAAITAATAVAVEVAAAAEAAIETPVMVNSIVAAAVPLSPNGVAGADVAAIPTDDLATAHAVTAADVVATDSAAMPTKSKRIRNIPKKDRRDIVLKDFSNEPLLSSCSHSAASPNAMTPPIVSLDSGSNSSSSDASVVVVGVLPPAGSDMEPIDVELEADKNAKQAKLLEAIVEATAATSTEKALLVSEHEAEQLMAVPSDTAALMDATVPPVAAQPPIATLCCFDFQEEEEDHEHDVLTSIANFKKKYYSPDKPPTDANKAMEATHNGRAEAAAEQAQKNLQLAAEIETLLEQTSAPIVLDMDGSREDVSVKALPIKERGKRIFKSRNRSRGVDEAAVAANNADFSEMSTANDKNHQEMKDDSLEQTLNISEERVSFEAQKEQAELQQQEVEELPIEEGTNGAWKEHVDAEYNIPEGMEMEISEAAAQPSEVEKETEQPAATIAVARTNGDDSNAEMPEHIVNQLRIQSPEQAEKRSPPQEKEQLQKHIEEDLDKQCPEQFDQQWEEQLPAVTVLEEQENEEQVGEEASIPHIIHAPVELYRRESAELHGIAKQQTPTPVEEEEQQQSPPQDYNNTDDHVVPVSEESAMPADESSNGLIKCQERVQQATEVSSRLTTPTDENSSAGISETGAEFGSPTSMLDDERLHLVEAHALTPTEVLKEDGTELVSMKTMAERNEDNLQPVAMEQSTDAPDTDDIKRIEQPNEQAPVDEMFATNVESNEEEQQQRAAKQPVNVELSVEPAQPLHAADVDTVAVASLELLPEAMEEEEIESPPHEALSGNELEAELAKIRKIKPKTKRKSSRQAPAKDAAIKTKTEKEIAEEEVKKVVEVKQVSEVKEMNVIKEVKKVEPAATLEDDQAETVSLEKEEEMPSMLTPEPEERSVPEVESEPPTLFVDTSASLVGKRRTRASLQQQQPPLHSDHVEHRLSNKSLTAKEAMPKTTNKRQRFKTKSPAVVKHSEEKLATTPEVVAQSDRENKQAWQTAEAVESVKALETVEDIVTVDAVESVERAKTVESPESRLSFGLLDDISAELEKHPQLNIMAKVAIAPVKSEEEDKQSQQQQPVPIMSSTPEPVANNSEPQPARKRRPRMKMRPRRDELARLKDGATDSSGEREPKLRRVQTPTADQAELAASARTNGPQSVRVTTAAQDNNVAEQQVRNLIVTVEEIMQDMKDVAARKEEAATQINDAQLAVSNEVNELESEVISAVEAEVSEQLSPALEETASVKSNNTAALAEMRSFRPRHKSTCSEAAVAILEQEIVTTVAAGDTLMLDESTTKSTSTPVANEHGQQDAVRSPAAGTPPHLFTSPMEKVRINVDVANPLSSQIASILAHSSSNQQQQKHKLPHKSAMATTLKRKKSIEDDIPSFIIERPLATYETDAADVPETTTNVPSDAVAHVQNMCPQVKITRKEKMFETTLQQQQQQQQQQLLLSEQLGGEHMQIVITPGPATTSTVGPQQRQRKPSTSRQPSSRMEQMLLQKQKQHQQAPRNDSPTLNKQLGIDTHGNKYVIIKTSQADLLLQPPSVPQQPLLKSQAPSYNLGAGVTMRAINEPKSLANAATQLPQVKPKSPAAAATGGRKHAGNTITLPSSITVRQQLFSEESAELSTAQSAKLRRKSVQQPPRRLTTTGAAETQTDGGELLLAVVNRRVSVAEAPAPSKIPKTSSSGSFTGDDLTRAERQLFKLQQQQRQKASNNTQANSATAGHPLHNRKPKKQPQQHRNSVQKKLLPAESAAMVQQQQVTSLAPPQTAVHSTTFSEEQQQQQILLEQQQQQLQMQTSTEEHLDGTSNILAVPTQPIPGYNETFLLCTLVNNNYKPIDNVPLYLDHDLNQLVPVPVEALDGQVTNLIVSQPPPEEPVMQQQHEQPVLKTMEPDSTQLICLQPNLLGDAEVAATTGGVLVQQATLAEPAIAADAANDEQMAIFMPPDGSGSEIVTDNAVILNIEGQQIILDAATFAHLLANPDATTQLITDDGTEFVLTREVLAALEAQNNEQLQLRAQQLVTAEGVEDVDAGATDILAVALAGTDLYGAEVLEIETSQGAAALQLLGGGASTAPDGTLIFHPPVPLPPPHLTPPITAQTNETNALLNQTPIMSPLEKPTTAPAALVCGKGKSAAELGSCLGSNAAAAAALLANTSHTLSGICRPNLEDSLAVLGVSTQSSTVPTSLELPITVTNPAIAPKVTMTAVHPLTPTELTELVQFQPHRTMAAAIATESTRIYHDPGS